MTTLCLTKTLNFRQKYSSLTPFLSQFVLCLTSHNSRPTSHNIGATDAWAVPTHLKFGGRPPKSPPMISIYNIMYMYVCINAYCVVFVLLGNSLVHNNMNANRSIAKSLLYVHWPPGIKGLWASFCVSFSTSPSLYLFLCLSFCVSFKRKHLLQRRSNAWLSAEVPAAAYIILQKGRLASGDLQSVTVYNRPTTCWYI